MTVDLDEAKRLCESAPVEIELVGDVMGMYASTDSEAFYAAAPHFVGKARKS